MKKEDIIDETLREVYKRIYELDTDQPIIEVNWNEMFNEISRELKLIIND